MGKRVLIPIATGFEEIETVTAVDILRRAGAEVVLAGVDSDERVTGRSNVSVFPDMGLDQALAAEKYDLVFLPGGLPNAHILRDDGRIIDAVKEQSEGNRYVAAICAAPLVLDRAGLVDGVKITSHPSIRDELSSARYTDQRVVTSSSIITSRAPGTSMEMAFKMVELLFDSEKVEQVNSGVLAMMP